MSRHGVLERKISFPPEAIFLSIVQDGDELELWKVLSSKNSKNIDVNRHNHAGVSALHQSVLNNNVNTVKMLLTHDADVNLADANGYTPLHTASACGFLQICSMLMVFGADLFLQTREGDLAVDLAKDSSTAAVLETEMRRQLAQRTYLQAWVWFHLKEYTRWLLVSIVFCIRTAATVVLRELNIFFERMRRENTLSQTTTSASASPSVSTKAPARTSLSSPSSLLSSSSSAAAAAATAASFTSSTSSSSSSLSATAAASTNAVKDSRGELQQRKPTMNDKEESNKKTD